MIQRGMRIGKMREKLYAGEMSSPIGRLSLYASGKGLLMVGFGNQTKREMTSWLRRRIPGADICDEQNAILEQTQAQLTEYFAGKRRDFDIRLDLRVQGFSRKVLDEIAKIRFGKLTTYGEIARSIRRPQASRAVGAATGANPIPIIIACHRVVGRDMKLTGFGGGLKTKRWLLEREGVALAGDRVTH